jgi:hypothetical protein
VLSVRGSWNSAVEVHLAAKMVKKVGVVLAVAAFFAVMAVMYSRFGESNGRRSGTGPRPNASTIRVLSGCQWNIQVLLAGFQRAAKSFMAPRGIWSLQTRRGCKGVASMRRTQMHYSSSLDCA